MLERLLELPTNDVNSTLYQTTQLVAEVLAADKVEAFLHDTATDALVASDVHDMPMELRQDATGIDQLLLVNGGRIVEVFLSGVPYLSGHADQDTEEMVGMQSEIATIFQVGTQHRGVLLASSSRPEFFSEQDLHFLEAVARWVGIMIHRAELVKTGGRGTGAAPGG
jgi:GAF domain-containing protein